MNDFSDIQDEVMLALEEHGTMMTLRRIDPGNYDVSTGGMATATEGEIEVQAVILSFNRREIDGFKILATDYRCIIGGRDLDFAPAVNFQIIKLNVDPPTVYHILAVKRYELGGMTMAYVCQVRDAANF